MESPVKGLIKDGKVDLTLSPFLEGILFKCFITVLCKDIVTKELSKWLNPIDIWLLVQAFLGRSTNDVIGTLLANKPLLNGFIFQNPELVRLLAQTCWHIPYQVWKDLRRYSKKPILCHCRLDIPDGSLKTGPTSLHRVLYCFENVEHFSNIYWKSNRPFVCVQRTYGDIDEDWKITDIYLRYGYGTELNFVVEKIEDGEIIGKDRSAKRLFEFNEGLKIMLIAQGNLYDKLNEMEEIKQFGIKVRKMCKETFKEEL